MTRPSLEELRKTNKQIDRFLTQTEAKPQTRSADSNLPQTRNLSADAVKAINNIILPPRL